jgi:hypothetical protein
LFEIPLRLIVRLPMLISPCDLASTGGSSKL